MTQRLRTLFAAGPGRSRARMKLHASAPSSWRGERVIARVTRRIDLPAVVRAQHALLPPQGAMGQDLPEGFGAILVRGADETESGAAGRRVVHLPDDLSYLDEGDVIRVDP